MSENSDATNVAAEAADGDVGQLPHFAFRAGGVRPPVKPALMTKSDRPMTAPSTGMPDRLPASSGGDNFSMMGLGTNPRNG